MNTYRVRHKEKNEFLDREAESPQEAVDMCFWNMGDCELKVKTPRGGWAKVDTGEIVEEPDEPPAGENPYPVEDDTELVEATDEVDPDADSQNDDADEEQPEEPAVDEEPVDEPEVVESDELTDDEKKKLEELKVRVKEGDVEKFTDDDIKNAYQNRLHVMQLARGAQAAFLQMGALLYDAREHGEWTILRYETFREYIEDLGLPMQNSYSWATRLIGIHEYLVLKMNLPDTILLEIGVAKLTRLLPAAREDRLTMDMVESAKKLSDIDLREMLGHNVGGGGDQTDMIICPRCGETINAKTATRVK